MSNKENISATVDPEVAAFLDQEHINKSGLINKLLKRYMNGDSSQDRMLQLREEQLEGQLNSLQTQAESIEEQLNSIRQRRTKREKQEQEQQEQLWNEAKSVLEVEEIGGTKIVTTEERFLHEWADKLDVTVDELKTEIVSRSDD